jgi:antirestriction protein ArdC
MDKSDFAKRLAKKLIEQLKAGTAPWQQPWEAGQMASPYNPTTGNRYRGVNILALMASDYADPRWMTYKQAQAQAWQVRAGRFQRSWASATGGCVETVGSDRKCHKRRQDDQKGRKIPGL